jgi:hypothetical protein
MNTLSYTDWKLNMMETLSMVEFHHDLEPGEVMRATGTSEADLRELFSFGWTAGHAAAAVIDALCIR